MRRGMVMFLILNGFNLGILTALFLWRCWGRDSFLRSYEKYRAVHGPYPHREKDEND